MQNQFTSLPLAATVSSLTNSTNLTTPTTMSTKNQTISIPYTALPAIGADLDGGIFVGLTTRHDGAHFAVILLPEAGKKLTWEKAVNWATKQGGELPSRPVAALMFANVKAKLTPTWHWTSEEDDASYAWNCGFGGGDQATSTRALRVVLLPSA